MKEGLNISHNAEFPTPPSKPLIISLVSSEVDLLKKSDVLLLFIF